MAHFTNTGDEGIKSSIEAWEATLGLRESAPPPPQDLTKTLGISAADAGYSKGKSIKSDPSVDKALQEALQKAKTQNQHKEVRNRAAFVQAVIDLIVLSKPTLRSQLEGKDTSQAGSLPKAEWSKVLLKVLNDYQEDLVTPPEIEGELFEHWELSNPVNYVQFLARVQVASKTTGGDQTTGRAKEMADARSKFERLASTELIRALDPNGRQVVTADDFANMLSTCKVKMNESQARTMHEDFRRNLKCENLSTDNALYCLASVGYEVPTRVEYEEVLNRIDECLTNQGINLVTAFRQWDVDKDGFLGLDEMVTGIRSLLSDVQASKAPSKNRGRARSNSIVSAGSDAEDENTVRYLNKGFEPKFLGEWTSIPQDTAAGLLGTDYIGYQQEDSYPGLIRFAKHGAKLRSQAGATATMLREMNMAPRRSALPDSENLIVDAFLIHMRECCHDINKVNILEFIRAIVPKSFIAGLKKVMLRDILRRVWMCKAALQIILSHHDPMAKGEIGTEEFRICITELNQTLKAQNANSMSENHILAVCDVASQGQSIVNYKDFLAGLIIVDTQPNRFDGRKRSSVA
jgi:Ca2+-binding EF-hand superfamily protein